MPGFEIKAVDEVAVGDGPDRAGMVSFGPYGPATEAGDGGFALVMAAGRAVVSAFG